MRKKVKRKFRGDPSFKHIQDWQKVCRRDHFQSGRQNQNMDDPDCVPNVHPGGLASNPEAELILPDQSESEDNKVT